jgi:HSP20 family protein
MPEKEEDRNKQTTNKENTASDNKTNSFTGFFRGIGNLIDLVANLENDEKSEERREGEITDPSGRMKAAFKFSIRTGLGEPLEFGSSNIGSSNIGSSNIGSSHKERATSPRPNVEEEIQPVVDIFDEETYVLLLIELPGVEEEDIHLEVNGDILMLSAANRYRKYTGEVVLPDEVDGSSVTSKYKNSVLEIRMSKKSHDSDHSAESGGSKSS